MRFVPRRSKKLPLLYCIAPYMQGKDYMYTIALTLFHVNTVTGIIWPLIEDEECRVVINKHGYIMARFRYNKRIYNMLAHRLVWFKAMGCFFPKYVIHHINGDILDNRLTNLQTLSHSEHSKLHALKQRR